MQQLHAYNCSSNVKIIETGLAYTTHGYDREPLNLVSFVAATMPSKRWEVSGFPLNFKLDAVLVRFGRLTPATLVPSVEFCGIHPQCNVMSCTLLLFCCQAR